MSTRSRPARPSRRVRHAASGSLDGEKARSTGAKPPDRPPSVKKPAEQRTPVRSKAPPQQLKTGDKLATKGRKPRKPKPPPTAPVDHLPDAEVLPSPAAAHEIDLETTTPASPPRVAAEIVVPASKALDEIEKFLATIADLPGEVVEEPICVGPPEPVSSFTPPKVMAPQTSDAPVAAPLPRLRSSQLPAPRKNDYLDRARKAAQAQPIEKPPRRFMASPLAVAACFAAPVLLCVTLVLFANSDDAPPAAETGSVIVASPQPEADAQAAAVQYASALRHFSVGENAQAIALLRTSADAGFPLAQYRLAKLYESGEGVPRDLTRARILTERAANAGHCPAMHDAGVFFVQGEAGPADEAAAFRWFRAAADCGVVDSQYNLGILYRQGRGAAADPVEALFWFLVAARSDNTNAFDQALDLATQLTPLEVEQARARARAFQASPERTGALGQAAGRAPLRSATQLAAAAPH